VVRRAALAGDLAQREQLSVWEAALMSSGLPIAGLDAAKPKLRFAIAAPLSAGIPGEAELLDVWLVERLARWRVREALDGRLPAGFELADLYDVWLGEAPLPGRVAASVYRAELGPEVATELVRAAAETLLAATELPRERRRGETTVAYDLRPFLQALDVEATANGTTLRMTLGHDPSKGVGRPDETLLALAEAMGAGSLEPSALVRERLVLAEPSVPEAPAPRGARRPPVPRSSAEPGPRSARFGGR
jgi:radical SAM-linked protein